MKTSTKTFLIPALVMALAVSSFGLAAAQVDDPVPACSGDSVAGTVVSVDETTGVVTIRLADDSECTVQLDGEYQHPITSLLGSYFDDVSAENLQQALDALTVPFSCPAGEDCAPDESGDMTGRVTDVTMISEGVWQVTVTYVDEEGNPQTFTFELTDPEQAQAYMDAMDGLMVQWQLKYDGGGNPFVVEAGDNIASLHDDGMGYGVIVKLYSMATDAADACLASTSEVPTDADAVDPCSVSLDGLVEAFKGGAGLGQLFQEYGKPSFLGIGHAKQAMRGDEKQPPDNACGYWRKHPEQAPASCLTPESSPSNNEHEHGGGKPPWAGQPGGPKSQD